MEEEAGYGLGDRGWQRRKQRVQCFQLENSPRGAVLRYIRVRGQTIMDNNFKGRETDFNP